jgi:hypothetical protein
MLVFNQAGKSSVDRAVARARKLKPRAKVLGYGLFSVSSSKPGVRYEVRFSADSLGQLVVQCQCKANSEFGLCCAHAASVAGLYKGQWTARREQAQAAPPALYCECGVEGADCESGRCQDCDLTLDVAYLEVLRSVQEDEE